MNIWFLWYAYPKKCLFSPSEFAGHRQSIRSIDHLPSISNGSQNKRESIFLFFVAFNHRLVLVHVVSASIGSKHLKPAHNWLHQIYIKPNHHLNHLVMFFWIQNWLLREIKKVNVERSKPFYDEFSFLVLLRLFISNFLRQKMRISIKESQRKLFTSMSFESCTYFQPTREPQLTQKMSATVCQPVIMTRCSFSPTVTLTLRMQKGLLINKGNLVKIPCMIKSF